MRQPAFLIALAFLTVAGTAAARDIKEDPFAYEEREAERKKQREQDEAEEEAKPTRSFSNSGDFVVSAERLVGYAHSSAVIKQPGPDLKPNYDRIHAFTNAGANDFGGFSIPRIAFDYFVSTGLSLGAALGYSNNSSDKGKHQFILASPRIGYAYMFGDVVGIWPRLGATYQIQFLDVRKAWTFAGTFDLPLVLVAGSNAMISLGPRVDVGFVGEYFVPNEKKQKMTSQEYGFSAGLSLFF